MAILALSKLKEHLGIASEDLSQDSVLNDIIDGVESHIIKVCGEIEQDDRSDVIDFEDGVGFAPNMRINSITSMTDSEGNTYTDDSKKSQLRAGVIQLDAEYDVELTVNYNSGYATVPDDIVLYAIRLCEYKYYKKAGADSESFEGMSIKYSKPDEAMLREFKKVVG